MTATAHTAAGAPAAGTAQLPLDIDRLSLSIDTQHGVVHAVNNVSLELHPGEILAIVGESGSGKTLTARAVLGLFPRAPAHQASCCSLAPTCSARQTPSCGRSAATAPR